MHPLHSLQSGTSMVLDACVQDVYLKMHLCCRHIQAYIPCLYFVVIILLSTKISDCFLKVQNHKVPALCHRQVPRKDIMPHRKLLDLLVL